MARKKSKSPWEGTRKPKGKLRKSWDVFNKYVPPAYFALDIGEGILQGLGLMNKGGKVGKAPKGCGAAMRGYGKAMKKKGK